MNLTTARSVKRAREINVRKVIGAMRSSLLRQFMGEALLVAFLSVAVAACIIMMVLLQFNQLTRKHITMPFSSTSLWLSIAALLLVTGLVSGSYPALYLSSFNPVFVRQERGHQAKARKSVPGQYQPGLCPDA